MFIWNGVIPCLRSVDLKFPSGKSSSGFLKLFPMHSAYCFITFYVELFIGWWIQSKLENMYFYKIIKRRWEPYGKLPRIFHSILPCHQVSGFPVFTVKRKLRLGRQEDLIQFLTCADAFTDQNSTNNPDLNKLLPNFASRRCYHLFSKHFQFT